MASNNYVVRITLGAAFKPGKSKYLVLRQHRWHRHVEYVLVASKAQATQMPYAVAEQISDIFWEKHWKREEFYSREVVEAAKNEVRNENTKSSRK